MISDLTHWDAVALTANFLAFGGSFLAAGSILFILANPILDPKIVRGLHRLVLMAALVAFFASFAQIGVQSGRLLDEGVQGMIDGEMLELVANGRLGDSVFIRSLGLVLACAFALSIPVSWLFGSIATVMIAASFSLVGHGTGEPRWLLSSLITVHLFTVSFWLGALWPLAYAAGDPAQIKTAGTLAHRFGKQASVMVGALMVAGSILAYQLVGSIALLFTSQYGITLLIKLAAVTVLLLLAMANKTRLVPKMLDGDQTSAVHLRRSIVWESFTFVIILAVTSVLTSITALPQQ